MKAKKKAWTKGQDPERYAKIAASKLGKKRPPHVIEEMRLGRIGKPQSADTKKKLSISQQVNRVPNKKALELVELVNKFFFDFILTRPFFLLGHAFASLARTFVVFRSGNLATILNTVPAPIPPPIKASI